MEEQISVWLNNQGSYEYLLYLTMDNRVTIIRLSLGLNTNISNADIEASFHRAVAQRRMQEGRLERFRRRNDEDSDSSSIATTDSLVSEQRRVAAVQLLGIRGPGATRPAVVADDSVSGGEKNKKGKPRATRKAKKPKHEKPSGKDKNKKHGDSGGTGGGAGIAY